MTDRRLVWAILIALTCLAALPAIARAQSAIAGVVKDASGAVLPGVTVEASSDVLIEKTRSVITDGQGQYVIVDLRPGVYLVTFTLAGFQTLKREALELPSNFAATVNADLKVGELKESITVSGDSHVVDVQTNLKTQVLSRDVLDAVPTAGTIQSIGQLVVGVKLSSPDVGGSRAMQQTYFAVHGVGASGTMVTVDGLATNSTMGDGSNQAYHNEAMIQEAVYQTAGGSAETITGGLNINLVPKDGGNRFMGGAKANKSPQQWQGNNLTARLQNLGVTSVDKIDNFYETNVEEGGPIARDRLWFYGAFRKAHYDKPIGNTFVTPPGLPYPVGYRQCSSRVSSCEQGVSDEKMDNPVARLTWQVSPRNKFAAYMDRAMRFRGHAMTGGVDPQTASVVWHAPIFATGSAKWTSTVSSRLLIEGGFSFNRQRYDNRYQPGIYAERGTAAWFTNVRHDDSSTSQTWNAGSAQLGNYPDRYNLSGSASYVTGSHNLKVGFQRAWGPYRRWNNANADLYQTYQNGAPFRVTVLNTPLEAEEYLDSNLGIYGQDSWRFRKLTVNAGLRWDYVKQHVVGQDAQVGRFATSAPYPDMFLPVWKDVSPRASVVYDLFGTGKTAVRFGFNKFMTAATTGFAQLYNPTALTMQQLAWTDLNGDDIAQGARGCVYKTPGCEIDFGNLPANFGVGSLSSFDPGLKRPYQRSYNLGFSHEVLQGVAITAEWFHSDFKDLIARNNVARTADSYTPVDVVSPVDGSVVRVFNVKAEFRNAVQNVDSTDPRLRRWYNGIEINLNARLPHGARIFGGTSIEKTLANSCSAAARDPSLLLYCDQTKSGIPWTTQFKIAGTYPLPWHGVTVSGAFQALPGILLGTDALPYGNFFAGASSSSLSPGTGFNQPNGQSTFWLVGTTTRYAANCTGPCTPNALVIPNLNTASFNVPLTAPQTEYTPRLNQIDFAVSKSFRTGRFSFAPTLDVFNAFNSDDYTNVRSMQLNATTYLQPSTILQGRVIRLGADVKW